MRAESGHEENTIEIAVLASGSGTNLQALIDTPDIRAHLSVVISDEPEAGALIRARSAGIQTTVVRWADYPDRDRFSSAVADAAEDSGGKGVVLAGFMRILSPSFIDRFPNRILNIHPSLLPAFSGVHAVGSALEHGVGVTGVTVHFVDEGIDSGPIILQTAVPVYDHDDEESLAQRILEQEHVLYPKAINLIAEKKMT